MSALKYVCLSDLHLGAQYSVLTWMDEDGKTSLIRPSETLIAFGAALRASVSALSGEEPPVLILLGDILDLGLSSTGAVAQALKQFVEVLFPANAPNVFSSKVLCVPGNHDHHLWRAAQDQYFLDHLAANFASDFIPDLPQHSHLFSQDMVSCNLLTQVMQHYPHLKDASVQICYPNLGLASGDGRRTIVLHHGHYIDAMYRALSALNVQLHGPSERPKSTAQLERENGPWIDFLWSGLGGGGAIARDATTLYETSRSAIASHGFAEQLSTLLLNQLNKGMGVAPYTPVTHGVTVGQLVKGLVDLTLVRGAEMERASYASVMSAAGLSDLRWYLGGPVLEQIVKEPPLPPGVAGEAAGGTAHSAPYSTAYTAAPGAVRPGDLDIDLSFIFGHTHKPFQGELDVRGYTRPVAIYNTGGWVMDQPTMAPTQGAALMLIDESLDVAALRLFNDPLNGTCLPVRVAGVGGFRDAENPFLPKVAKLVESQRAAWQAFSDAASKALGIHARVLLRSSLDDIVYSP